MVKDIHNYSIKSLKLLASKLDNNKNNLLSSSNYLFANKLFNNKNEFTSFEFCKLLNLLDKPKDYFRSRLNNLSFDKLVQNNLDFLIDSVTKSGIIPKCLRTLDLFRDYCIEKNRIDLAVNCLLPKNIIDNDNLIILYSKELNINLDDFYRRLNWIYEYFHKNNNVFNSLLGTFLKNSIFKMDKIHYERFINDINIQLAILRLNDKEQDFFCKMINLYNYKEYDITHMFYNVINNIHDYDNLLSNLDIELLTDDDLRTIVNIFQLSNNPFMINDLNDIRNYKNIKKDVLINKNIIDINELKNIIFMTVFNIDLNEAIYIDFKYSHDNDNKYILDKLAKSNLSGNSYKYLLFMNGIINCNDLDELYSMYNNLDFTFDSDISLKTLLKSEYTKLYNESIFNIKNSEEVFGPKDSIFKSKKYGDSDVKYVFLEKKLDY